MTVREAREKLMVERWEADGVDCPCCSQRAKVYRRPLYGTMARDLIKMYRANGLNVFHLPTLLGHSGGDSNKLRFWGLIEEEPNTRPDGSKRAGYWRVTEDGEEFIMLRAKVQSHILLYAQGFLGLDGDYISIDDCLGKKFNYTELMGWTT
jgi:hypothetical protein